MTRSAGIPLHSSPIVFVGKAAIVCGQGLEGGGREERDGGQRGGQSMYRPPGQCGWWAACQLFVDIIAGPPRTNSAGGCKLWRTLKANVRPKQSIISKKLTCGIEINCPCPRTSAVRLISIHKEQNTMVGPRHVRKKQASGHISRPEGQARL